MNERSFGWDEEPAGRDAGRWLLDGLRYLAVAWRPHLGWATLALCMLLVVLPAAVLAENGWLRGASLVTRLYMAGPLALLCVWLVGGWRSPHAAGRRMLRLALQGAALLLLSAFLVSQLLAEWLPAASALWQAAAARDATTLVAGMADALHSTGLRYALWWQGVQSDSAMRDDLVVLGFALGVVWGIGLLTAGLVRRTQQGLLAALPVLWLVGLIMLYSPLERWLMVGAVALALSLHFVLDQQRLVARWRRQSLDYSPLILVERGLTVGGLLLLVTALAAVTPNLYWLEIASRYYALIAPINDRLEAASVRAFPGLTGVNPWGGRDSVGGLPNEFLVRAGPELGDRPILRVRTSEPVRFYDEAPLGHNLRGATFSHYDGRGWQNPARLERTSHAADAAWAEIPDMWRRPLLQSVSLSIPAGVLFAAGEPQAVSVEYQADERFPGDLVKLSAAARSYTVSSLIPALSDEQLRALPAWGTEVPLGDEFARYLDLPDSVTERTRRLAADLTAGASSPYEQAAAIEQSLRTFAYDLDVPPLPDDVTDVADYFLFDLRRGYCDYYATSFVVLARAAGLPARFATGFVPGSWDAGGRQWIVTEAEAHSWPEVYFPEAGWVAFEPTAGRPELARVGLVRAAGGAPPSPVVVEPLAGAAFSFDRRWLWLVVPGVVLLAVALAGVRRWRLGREDPWQGLVTWGERLGRPLATGDTVLEYGEDLAGYVTSDRQGEPELRRIVARDVVALSEEVSALHYAPPPARAGLRRRILVRWQRLRSFLSRIKRR